MNDDPLIGSNVEIRSTGGMLYAGIVDAIRVRGELGELFELGSAHDPGYRRLVYVTNRQDQIRLLRSSE